MLTDMALALTRWTIRGVGMKHLVTMCCFCDKIRDDRGIGPDRVIWQEYSLYMAEYGLRPANIRFFHTYCPPCLAYYQAFLSSSSQEVRRRPKEKRA